MAATQTTTKPNRTGSSRGKVPATGGGVAAATRAMTVAELEQILDVPVVRFASNAKKLALRMRREDRDIDVGAYRNARLQPVTVAENHQRAGSGGVSTADRAAARNAAKKRTASRGGPARWAAECIEARPAPRACDGLGQVRESPALLR